MIYATVTTYMDTKIQFNIDKFFCTGTSDDGETVIILIDNGVQSKIICKEKQENIFDNIVEIYGGKNVK